MRLSQVNAVRRQMHPSLVAGLSLAVAAAALGCRDATTAPAEPIPAAPQAGPIANATALAFYQLSANDAHTCAVTTSNRAYCWGTNYEGMLGDGTRDERHVPTAVMGGLAFRQISAGVNHTCGVTTDFRAYCWGDDGWG